MRRFTIIGEDYRITVRGTPETARQRAKQLPLEGIYKIFNEQGRLIHSVI